MTDKTLSDKQLDFGGFAYKDVREFIDKTKVDNELSVVDLKKRLKDYPDDEFLLGRIQGIRTAEDHMEKRAGSELI